MKPKASFLPALFSLVLLASPAAAATLDAMITDEDGKPVADAVISLTPEGAAGAQNDPAALAKFPISTINQIHETFVPDVVVIGPGGSVLFHNADKTKHHAYSFAPIRSFEFILNPGEDSQPIRFDQPGIAAIGCNIHDKMAAWVVVTRTPYVAITDAAGHATITAPDGAYTDKVWHPRLKLGVSAATGKVTLGSSPATLAVSLALAMPHPAKETDMDAAPY